MNHRHLTTNDWRADSIESVLERGDLPDWRELFAAARADAQIASEIARLARSRPDEPSHLLAAELVVRCLPECL